MDHPCIRGVVWTEIGKTSRKNFQTFSLASCPKEKLFWKERIRIQREQILIFSWKRLIISFMSSPHSKEAKCVKLVDVSLLQIILLYADHARYAHV